MSDYIEICPNCLEPCRIVRVDMGIGHYEYWGAKGIDRQLATVTECCEVAPKQGVYWDSKDVDPCHLNGGDVFCSKCPAREICYDALPLEDEV